ncbi:MAG: hypothetical protein GY858_09710, partial [Candidatus Omnitrophica bacterium]|nr:hypothetical protein [Candidatus Omnitrophota bacterium]
NHPYFSIPLPCRRRCKKPIKKRRSKNLNALAIDELKEIFDLTGQGVYQAIQFLKKQTLRTIKFCYFSVIKGFVSDNNHFKLFLLAFFAGHYKVASKLPCSRLVDRVIIPYWNHNEGLLNLNQIFNCSQMRRTLPLPHTDRRKVQVTFRFNPPLANKFHNYSKTLKEVADFTWLQNFLQCTCECATSIYIYQPFGHIVTGDISILPTHNLKIAFSKGSKFRLPVFLTKDKLLLELSTIFSDYCCRVSKRSKIPIGLFSACKKIFFDLVNKRITSLSKHSGNTPPSLTGADWRCLHKFQDKFVIVPADKASDNFIFVCKYYYLQVMCTELGIVEHLGIFTAAGNGIYEPVFFDLQSILNKHRAYASYLGLVNKAEDEVLPTIFAVPKLHKSPYKFRFIAGAHKSSIKKLSLLLHRILHFLRTHLRNYAAIASRRTGKKFFWSVDNSEAVIQLLSRAKSSKVVFTADFSTLFTNLPHTVIKTSLRKLIDLCYKNSGKAFINVTHDKVRYCKDLCASNLVGGYAFLQGELFELLDFVLDNTFVTFAGKVFRQCKGVPMGGNASPLIADLTLAMLEFEFVKNYNHIEWPIARFVDDLIVLDCPDFLILVKVIYSNELILECTCLGNHAHFLDLDILLANRDIIINVYNKVDSFPFKVNRFGYPDNTVPLQSHVAVLHSQLVRYCCICSNEDLFIEKSRDLFSVYFKW